MTAAQAKAWVSSGNRDIDLIRGNVAAVPTTAANSLERQAMLYAWHRLLMHQGIELTAFEPVLSKIKSSDHESLFRAIDEGFAVLETIQSNPRMIPVIRGNPRPSPLSATPTDWARYQHDAAQTGYTGDPGPARGDLLWRFHLGHQWTARPAIAAGRVYVASPGMTTAMYCLDEKTGAIVWKARQYAVTYLSPPPVESDITLFGDRAIARSHQANGEPGQLIYVNKNDGIIHRRVDANPSETRFGYAPPAADERFLVYKSRQLTTVIVKLASSGGTWWTFRAGEMQGDPALDGERVYAATQEGTLYCLNLKGAERIAWSFRAEAPLNGTPASANGRVYIGANDGMFYALDAVTGKIDWSYRAGVEDRALTLFSTAHIANGRVYVGSADRHLYCFDETSGRLLWKRNAGDWVRSRPLVIGQTVFVAALNGVVIALREGDGKILWREPAGAVRVFGDLIGNEEGLLVSDSDLFLTSLSPRDGRVQWRVSLLECAHLNGERELADAAPSLFQSSPIVAQGNVYIGGPDRFVHAVDAETGKEVWRFETSGKVAAAPIFAEGRVYFGHYAGDQDFYAVDAKTGRLLWKRALGWTWMNAGYADGKIYAGSTKGDYYCLDARDGKTVWTRKFGAGVFPSAAMDDATVYAGSWDGHYYALDKHDGRIKWSWARPGWPYHLGGRPDSAAVMLWKGSLMAQSLGKYLVALKRLSGKMLWEFAAPAHHLYNGTPAAHGDRIYTSVLIDAYNCPSGAKLFALDDRTGKPVWQYNGGGGLTSPAIARDKLFFGSTADVFFTCAGAKGNGDGTTDVIWRYKLGGVVEESILAVYGARAYVLCNDGNLYALQ
jgi:outer membrane protein assembly factor BamB